MTAAAGTVFIAAGAFWLSFTSLADLAARSGIGAGQAWAWPLIVDGIIVVTSPQQLVGMIVEKAVRMAELMKIPVLALVQNMSYVKCPGCDEVIHPFGETDIADLAKKYSIPATAELPIQKDLATACDAGLIELFEGDWLNGLADTLEELLKSEKK